MQQYLIFKPSNEEEIKRVVDLRKLCDRKQEETENICVFINETKKVFFVSKHFYDKVLMSQNWNTKVITIEEINRKMLSHNLGIEELR